MGPWSSVAIDISSQAVFTESFLVLHTYIPVADGHKFVSLQKAGTLGCHTPSRSQEGLGLPGVDRHV